MILYLGNNLSRHGNTPSSIEILGKLLSVRYSILLVSNKRSQVLRWLDMMWAIIRNRNKVNIVLIDTYSTLGFYYALGAAIFCKLFSLPYMPILRGGNLKLRLENNPHLSRFVFEGAKKLIAPSGYLAQVFQKFGLQNVHYIPNSINLSDYKFKERFRFTPRLLWVRSFHKIYNPEMAIQVLQNLKLIGQNAQLCMVGPDRDNSLFRCQEVVQQIGMTVAVKFTGVLSKNDWHKMADDYDIFINTTTVDNTPISVIEAMALGLPIVSTNVGGIPYLLTDNETGLLVDPGDVSEMVEKIIQLIENPALAQQLAINARKKIETFDWESVKHSWFEILDEFEEPKLG